MHAASDWSVVEPAGPLRLQSLGGRVEYEQQRTCRVVQVRDKFHGYSRCARSKRLKDELAKSSLWAPMASGRHVCADQTLFLRVSRNVQAATTCPRRRRRRPAKSPFWQQFTSTHRHTPTCSKTSPNRAGSEEITRSGRLPPLTGEPMNCA